MEKYMKIQNTYERMLEYMKDAKIPYVVEEKIDGSQIRGKLSSEGVIEVGSKSVDFNETTLVPKEFKLGVENMTAALEKLKGDGNNYVLFGEYLQTNRHNTIHYDRVPKNNIYLFDAKVNWKWLDEGELQNLARQLDFEPVVSYGVYDEFPNTEQIEGLLKNATSVLGGEVEGFVIKNRSILFERYDVENFFAYKFVRKAFKELNAEAWKTERKAGVRSIDDLVEFAVGGIGIKPLWNKAITHLRDAGELENNMRDMPKLFEAVQADIDEEFKESLEEVLYNELNKKIKKAALRGIAEYYKDYLFRKLETDLAEVKKE